MDLSSLIQLKGVSFIKLGGEYCDKLA